MTSPLQELAQVATADAWLVGGVVRDQLLGRSTTDYDVVVSADPRELARSLARVTHAHQFALSDAFGGWRVIARDRSWQVDVLPLMGSSLEDDLVKRDFTVNALARPVSAGDIIDPFDGVADLQAGQLRMVSVAAFERDPLRVLRLARLACELGFEAEPSTVTAARAAAPGLVDVAAERVFAELKLILLCDAAVDGLQLMDRLGATEVVLPELSELRGVKQSHFHHLDVHEHTHAVLGAVLDLERDPAPVFGEHSKALRAALDQPLANELTRGQALRFGALFHDIAKPRTRQVTDAGRVTFLGHDAQGAELAVTALHRLRASQRLGDYVAALTRHHLRLGFLVHEMPLGRRAVYRYLKTCEPVGVDVTVLSVADRLATRGAGSEEAISKHLSLARQVMGDALEWEAHPPRPPLRGDELAREMGVKPGPAIGRVLAKLEEESFAGEISGREEALRRGRELFRVERGG